MKKTACLVLGILVLLVLAACSPRQTAFPTPVPSTATDMPPSATVSPSETPTETPSPTPLPPETVTPSATIPSPTSEPLEQTYGVVLVAGDDVLNVRTGPGVNYPIAFMMPPTDSGFTRTGNSQMVGSDTWVEIRIYDGRTGWVNSYYVTEIHYLCDDPRGAVLLQTLEEALLARDGDRLATAVSPVHGLRINLWTFEETVVLDPSALRTIFTSTKSYPWGVFPYSGQSSTGTFRDFILPKLLEVFQADYSIACGYTQMAYSYLPSIYYNLNFFSAYRPAEEGMSEMDWREWLVGIEYVEGVPYLFNLVHFQWEP